MSTSSLRKNPIADYMLHEGWIDRSQYNNALDEYERTRRSLLRIFADMGVMDDKRRLDVLRKTTRYRVVDLSDTVPREDVARHVDREFCRRRLAVPLEFSDRSVVVAMDDPTDVRTISDFEKLYSTSVRPVIAKEAQILETIDRLPTDLRESQAAIFKPEETKGYAFVSTLSLVLMVFIPIAVFWHFISNTATGEQWWESMELDRFASGIFFMIVWGSWAAIAYFINDLIFGKPEN